MRVRQLARKREFDGKDVTHFIIHEKLPGSLLLYDYQSPDGPFVQITLSDERNHLISKDVMIAYEYEESYTDNGKHRTLPILWYSKDKEFWRKEYSPIRHCLRVSNDWNFYPAGRYPGGSIQLAFREMNNTLVDEISRRDMRIFQFITKWINIQNLSERFKEMNDSFMYTKGLEDDLNRVGIKLPYHLRLLSWNGQLESEETGVIAKEELTEVFSALISIR